MERDRLIMRALDQAPLADDAFPTQCLEKERLGLFHQIELGFSQLDKGLVLFDPSWIGARQRGESRHEIECVKAHNMGIVACRQAHRVIEPMVALR